MNKGPSKGKKENKGNWIWDRRGGGLQDDQINKYEQGRDYVFFQGPAPKTADQGLPNFLSKEDIAEMPARLSGVRQIAVTITVSAVPTTRPPLPPRPSTTPRRASRRRVSARPSLCSR